MMMYKTIKIVIINDQVLIVSQPAAFLTMKSASMSSAFEMAYLNFSSMTAVEE